MVDRLLRVFAYLFIVTSALGGCTYAQRYRVEQVSLVGDRFNVIVGAGTTASTVEGAVKSHHGWRYYLLTYDATAPTCPPVRPSQMLDASIGLGPLNMDPGVRVDFLMGAYSDRIVRVVSNLEEGGGYHQRVAILGHDPHTGRWSVLRSWAFTSAGSKKPHLSSIDGKYVILNNPVRVIDTQTLHDVSGDDIPAMVQDQYAKAVNWEDWNIRSFEEKFGTVYHGPIEYGLWIDYLAWDLENHKPLKWDGQCDAFVVLTRPPGLSAIAKALDVDAPLRSKGFTKE